MNMFGDHAWVTKCVFVIVFAGAAYLSLFFLFSVKRRGSLRLSAQQLLVMRQLQNSYSEIRFKHIIFAIMNVASLWYIYQLSRKLRVEDMKIDQFTELLKAIAALFTPFVTYVIQGYIFPRGRKINILRHILFKKEKLDDYENKVLYDDEK